MSARYPPSQPQHSLMVGQVNQGYPGSDTPSEFGMTLVRTNLDFDVEPVSARGVDHGASHLVIRSCWLVMGDTGTVWSWVGLGRLKARRLLQASWEFTRLFDGEAIGLELGITTSIYDYYYLLFFGKELSFNSVSVKMQRK